MPFRLLIPYLTGRGEVRGVCIHNPSKGSPSLAIGQNFHPVMTSLLKFCAGVGGVA